MEHKPISSNIKNSTSAAQMFLADNIQTTEQCCLYCWKSTTCEISWSQMPLLHLIFWFNKGIAKCWNQFKKRQSQTNHHNYFARHWVSSKWAATVWMSVVWNLLLFSAHDLIVWKKKNILRRFKILRSRKSTIYGTSNVFASTDYGESCVCS